MTPLRSRSARRNLAAAALFFAARAVSLSAADISSLPDGGPEAPSTLLAVDMNSGDAELTVDGSWKGEVIAAGGMKLTDLGAKAVASDTPLLFTQTVDLTLSLLVLDRWLVEASFVDDYDLNTYRAAYLGAAGETVQYVGVGNTGLDFPEFPYADLSGATPNSFGSYAKFGSGPLSIHALVRYDSATREEKTYVGTKERSVSDVSISSHLKGRAFVLPDSGLDAAPVVYLEDPDGTLSGSDGRKYRKAKASEASSSATLGIVELSSTPTRRVAVAYEKSSSEPWTSSLGSYGRGGSGSGFLGAAQAAFEAVDEGIDLASYPQCGGSTGKPAAIAIGGTAALVVYEPGSFSPFELQNRYGPPSSASSDASADLVHRTSGSLVEGYALDESDSSSFTITSDDDGETVTTTGRFFVLSNDDSSDRRGVLARYPLIAIDPRAYLPGGKGSGSDVALRFTSYGGSGSYDIGTDVVAGSVIVTRGGIRDTFAKYDADSGVVTLSTPAGAGEIIKISYLKTSQDRRFGSIAAGLGAVYQPDDSFSARTALTLRWNVSGNAYTTDTESSPGSVMLSGGAAWDYENLKADVRSALYYENPDTTGLYRAAGMESSEFSLDFSLSDAIAAYPPESPSAPTEDSEELYEAYWVSGETGMTAAPAETNRSDLVYRDYVASDSLGNKTLKPIDWSGASVDSSKEGPYTVSDSSLGTVYVADYELGEGATEDGTFALWTGYQIPLSDDADALSSAGKIIVPYRYYGLEGDDAVRAYVQIGSLADDDDNYESPELVWSAPIHSAAISGSAYTETSWAYTEIEFDDAARERLEEARSLRVVVRLIPATSSPSSVAAAGRLLILPPVVQGSEFRPIVVSSGEAETAGDEVTAVAEIDASLKSKYKDEIERVHPDGESQRVLAVSWEGLAAETAAGADGYPSPFPLWSYGRLSFFLRGPAPASDGGTYDGATFRVIIAANSDSLNDSGAAKRFLDVTIPANAFSEGTWSKVDIDYAVDKGVYVGGDKVKDATVVFRSSRVSTYRKKASKRGGEDGPQYLAVVLEPAEGATLTDGSFSVDEFALETPTADFGVSGGASVAWSRPGAIVGTGRRALLSDLELEGRTENVATGNPLPDGKAAASDGSTMMSGAAGATVLGAKVSTNLGVGSVSGDFRWNGGHALSVPLGPLRLSEAFSIDPDGETASRKAGIALSGPFSASLQSALSALPTKTTRSWKSGVSLDLAAGGMDDGILAWDGFGISADGSAAYVSAAKTRLFDTSYQDAWLRTGEELVPDEGAGERKRNFAAGSSMDFRIRPVGLSPQANGSSSFSASSNSRESEADFTLAFPLRVADFSGSFDLVRSYSRTMEAEDDDTASDDMQEFSAAVESAERLWAAAPFATLGSGVIVDDFRDATDESLEAAFSDGIETSFNLPRAIGLNAFLVPASIESNLARKLDRSLDTVDDYIATSTTLTFSATNVFGAFGTNPIFSFYKDDEFSTEAEFTAKFPKDDDTTWETSLRHYIAFYGFKDSSLSLTNILKFGSESISEGGSLSWTSPVENSLLRTLYRMTISHADGWSISPFLKELADDDERALIRETLDISITKNDDVAWSWGVKHESIIKALKSLTLTAWGSLAASGESGEDAEEGVDFTAKIGISLSLLF